MELLAALPLLIIDDLGMRKLGPKAAEELLEIIMRRYEGASTLLTSNRPVEDWGKTLGDSAAVTAMLDRLLHLSMWPSLASETDLAWGTVSSDLAGCAAAGVTKERSRGKGGQSRAVILTPAVPVAGIRN